MSMDYRKLLETLSNADHDELLDNIDNAICAIANLLARAEAAEARAEKAERERDAAVEDLRIAEDCDTCKSKICVPRGGNGKCRYEWRGIKEE